MYGPSEYHDGMDESGKISEDLLPQALQEFEDSLRDAYLKSIQNVLYQHQPMGNIIHL
jgi:hypothetical protein